MNFKRNTPITFQHKQYSKQQASSFTASEARGTALAAASVNAELVLIRGLPGSGKTTMASVLAMIGFKHFEADMFFEVDGVYRFNAAHIRQAHEWCQHMTRQSLAQGENVVVSNTFTTVWEMEPYFSMTKAIRVIETKAQWGNVHDVPAEAIRRMASRWESMPRGSIVP